MQRFSKAASNALDAIHARDPEFYGKLHEAEGHTEFHERLDHYADPDPDFRDKMIAKYDALVERESAEIGAGLDLVKTEEDEMNWLDKTDEIAYRYEQKRDALDIEVAIHIAARFLFREHGTPNCVEHAAL